MLIILEYQKLSMTTTAIAEKFHVSDSYAHDVFDRYVKLDRLPLTEAVSVDEVHVEMDTDCKYALVILDNREVIEEMNRNSSIPDDVPEQ